MKLRCERDVLAEALATAGRAVASRGALPVLSGVRLELAGDRLTITGSDLELTVTVELSVAGLADGVAVVPSRLVNDIVKALEPGAVELETGDDDARLAVRDLPGVSVLSSGKQVLVPSRALAELSRALGDGGELTLRLGERDASFATANDSGGIVLTTRLIEGEYPNYQGLIPQNQPNLLTVPREPLIEALRRVKLLARDATPVRLIMSADGLELKAVTQDVGEGSESLDASYQGEDLTVAFNPDYLLAGIEAASGEEITLSTMDSLKPAVVRTPASDDYLYLLMPVRVQ
jgi:DNA polymerase-3 subunit beta